MARIIDGTEMNMIGSNLRRLRMERGWSQQKLSDKLEMLAIYVCRGSISRIEDKQRTVTDIELYGFSQVLGVPIEALFEDYQSSFGFEEGSSKWKSVLSSGDITWSEQRLRSGDWTAYMIGIDSDGELSGLYQLLQFTVEQEVASAEYNRWLGTWMVSDKNGEPLFEIQIIPSENNMWYYMAGWESSNVFGFDTYDPALMPELYFDKETGKMLFISQYVNSMVSGSETVDFYFTGTFTYGNTYVLGDQVLNLRMAESTFVNSTYSEAAISSLTFHNSGMEFPIESICYMYYNGSQLGSISLAPPTLPLTMTKKVTE
jgi:transcriptional regulator with XRE-family HTH domain